MHGDVKVKFGNKHDVYEVLVSRMHCRMLTCRTTKRIIFVSVAKMLQK